MAFYTYDNNGKANFYAGSSDFDNWRTDETKSIPMAQTSGGNVTNLQAINFATDVLDAGMMNIHFVDCSHVEVGFNLLEPTSQEQISKEVVLSKLVGIPDEVCQAPSLLHN